MENVFYYKTDLNWKEGRIGEISEPTLDTIKVATPPEFPKGVPNIWSPEHLYVASVNVCLMTTFLAVAENSRLEFENYSAEATGKLEKVERTMQITEIVIKPKITLKNKEDEEKALRIINKSEDVCLISNSIKTKVILEPIIETV
ncbi:MAG: OsmC family protein [Rhodothermaceae bacterium]